MPRGRRRCYKAAPHRPREEYPACPKFPMSARPGAPEVSVIVPHLNQPELLRDLLESLFAQDFDMARAEVIVVDNGSRALPRGGRRRLPRGARSPRSRPRGPGRRATAAWRCRGRRSSPSSTATAGSTAPGSPPSCGHFAADPGLDILGGDIRLFPEDPANPTAAEAFECVYAFPQTLYIFRKGYSVTANMATRRRVFDAVGPFGGIEISEDLDWGRRARALGHLTRWRPDAIVLHPARRTMDELRAKTDRLVSYDFRSDAAGLAGRARWVAKAPGAGGLAARRDPAPAAHRPARRLPRPPARLPGPRRHPALPGAADARGAGLRGGARRQHPLEPRRPRHGRRARRPARRRRSPLPGVDRVAM